MIEFISGLMIGGLFGILLMCFLQIYRDNEAQRRIDKAIEYIKECNKKEGLSMYVDTWQHLLPLLNILGGDVDEN